MSTKSTHFYFCRPWLTIHLYNDGMYSGRNKLLDVQVFGRRWRALPVPFTRGY